jgi:predicted RNA-binding Zn ribbon-like protein
MAEPRELPIVGGNLALDFANTVDDPLGPARHDHVSTYDELLVWSARVGMLHAGELKTLRRSAKRRPRAASAAVRRAQELRDAVNGVFGAVASGETVPSERWAVLRRAASDGLSHAAAHPSGVGYGLEWSAEELLTPVWMVADAAVMLLRSGDLRRVKQCAGCPWLFLDSSRSGSRRWCSMEDCGTHEKIKRYVAKRAAARR